MKNLELPSEGGERNVDTVEAKKRRLIGELLAYDYAKLMHRLRAESSDVETNYPATGEFFKASPLHARILRAVDEVVAQGSVALLVGATQMGKSSISYTWTNEDQRRVHVDCSSGLSPRGVGRVKDAAGVCFEEVDPADNTVFDCVQGFRTSGKQIVLSSALGVAPEVVKKLAQEKIPVQILNVTPVSDEEMRGYLVHQFHLEDSDPIIPVLVELCGGALVIANKVMQQVRDAENPGTDIHAWLVHFWRRVQSATEQNVDYWNHQRTLVSEEYLELIPDPFIAKISPSEFSKR